MEQRFEVLRLAVDVGKARRAYRGVAVVPKSTVFAPGARGVSEPRQRNVPESPGGRVTVPETRSPSNARSSATSPCGVGVVERMARR